MKKRIIAIVLVAIVLATVLSGCTLFVRNDERDYRQVLATVQNKGITASITKGEFYEYYTQNAPTYMQYYQWTAARCVNEFMNALAKKEIIIIEARDYYSKLAGVPITTAEIDLLSTNEKNFVIKMTNKTFQDRYDADLKQNIADDKANNATDDDEEDATDDTKLPTARPALPEEEDETTYNADTVYPTAEKFFDFMDKKAMTALEKKTYKELKKSLEDQYKNYEFFLLSQVESRLITRFQDDVKDGKIVGYSVNITDEEIVKKYNIMLNKQQMDNVNETTYNSALSGEEMVVFHNNKYYKVKSLLLKFSEAQSEILTNVKAYYKGNADYNTDLINQFRDMLVFGNKNGLDQLQVSDKYLKLLVHVSNLDYDVDAECTDKNCTCKACENNPNYDKDDKKCKIELEDANGNFIENVPGCTCEACVNNAFEKYNVPFQTVIADMAVAVEKAGVDAAAEYATKYKIENQSALGKQMFVAQARIKEFERWMYKANDDSGIFEKGEYLGTPDGKKSEYVTEYTALIRAIMNDNANIGAMSTSNTEYTIDGKKIPIHTIGTGDGTLSYIVNDFGVHIVMISTIPVDTNINAGDSITSINAPNNKDTYYALGLDAVIGFDDKTGKPITLKEQLRIDEETKAKTNLYAKYEKDFLKDFGTVMFDKKNSAVFKLNGKIFGQLVTLTGAEKKDLNIKY